MLLQELKQSNKPAFNFAIAGFVSLLFALIGLVLLGQGLKEQKQIAKQVGDLQVIAQNIQHLITAKSLLHHGEAAVFLSLENLVKDFNQQWRVFKQQHDYSDQKIKAVDEVWQRINKNAEVILANKKEIVRLNLTRDSFLVSINSLQKINQNLINALLKLGNNKDQLILVRDFTAYLDKEANSVKVLFETPEYFIGYEDDEIGRALVQIDTVLSTFLIGGDSIKKIKGEKIREIIKQEKMLIGEFDLLYQSLYLEGRHKIYRVKEFQSAIYRDSSELRRMLYKLNNHNLNKGLIVFTICAWLSVFVCAYGYVKALRIVEVSKL